MRYNNYLFDLYGTLVDIKANERRIALWRIMARYFSMKGAIYTPEELRKKYQELDKIKRVELAKKYSKKMGEVIKPEEVEIQIEDIFCHFFEDKGISYNEQQMLDFILFFRVISIEYMELYEDTLTVLRTLRAEGKKVFLLSNAQKLFTEPEVKYFGLDKEFDDIFYSSDYGFKKPSSHFYKVPFDKYNLVREESVMIGNEIQSDILGALSYGIDSYFINTGGLKVKETDVPKNCVRIEKLDNIVGLPN